MWLRDLFGRKKVTGKVTQYAERDNSSEWLMYFNQFLNPNNKIECYTRDNAYNLALSIAEVFYPIDYIADACASLDYKIVDRDTLEEVTFINTNIQSLINKPNPYQKFSDLVYLGVFSKLSDGNVYDFTKIPDSYKNINQDNITNIWTLQPNVTKPILKKTFSDPFGIKDSRDLIENYVTFFFNNRIIDPKFINHHTLLDINLNGVSESPLNAVEKNINNLIQVYSARYNVYAKSLNGGILSYDGVASTDISAQITDPVSRDSMIDDLKKRNGLTGDRNFIGVTTIPMKFIKTIASIKDLEPFKETEADAVAIAGIYGIPNSLVNKLSEPKYSNFNESERKVWQNVIKAMAIERGEELSKAYSLPENQCFYPDFSNVEILQEDKKTSLEADKLLIENLSILTDKGVDVKEALDKLREKYNNLDI